MWMQAAQREEAYEETIGDLTERLKDVSMNSAVHGLIQYCKLNIISQVKTVVIVCLIYR